MIIHWLRGWWYLAAEVLLSVSAGAVGNVKWGVEDPFVSPRKVCSVDKDLLLVASPGALG